MKVTIRFSVSGESDGALRNKLTAALAPQNINLKPGETATYESTNISEADLCAALAAFWSAAAGHNGHGTIDHVWMYAGS